MKGYFLVPLYCKRVQMIVFSYKNYLTQRHGVTEKIDLRASVALLLRWWQQCEKYNLLPFGVYPNNLVNPVLAFSGRSLRWCRNAWVVERTMGWMNNFRGLSKHYDYDFKTAESKIDLASIFYMNKKVDNKTRRSKAEPRKRRKNQKYYPHRLNYDVSAEVGCSRRGRRRIVWVPSPF